MCSLCKRFMSRFHNWNFKIKFDVIWHYLFCLKTGTCTPCSFDTETVHNLALTKSYRTSLPLIEGQNRRLCLSRFKPFNSPQPEPLEQIILFSLTRETVFSDGSIRLWKTDGHNLALCATCTAIRLRIAALAGTRTLLGLLLNSGRVFLEYAKIEQAKELLCWYAKGVRVLGIKL